MSNDLKSMSKEGIKKYIRFLERDTKSEPIDDDTLDGMSFFEWEDLIANLEKERDFDVMSKSST